MQIAINKYITIAATVRFTIKCPFAGNKTVHAGVFARQTSYGLKHRNTWTKNLDIKRPRLL